MGLKTALISYRSLLAKQAAKFIFEPNNIWVKLMQDKYQQNHSPSARRKDSWLWRGAEQNLHLIESNSKWTVGDGQRVRLWYNIWLREPLLILYPLMANTSIINTNKVREFMDSGKKWSTEKMQSLPEWLRLEILEY